MRIALIIRIDGNGGISEHRFGTRRRNGDKQIASFYGILEIPEMPRIFRVIHFHIGKSGFTPGTPVDDPAPAVNKPALI